jgi:predicted nucleotidyltransferase
METTKNNLSPYITHFFKKLSLYLDKQLLFFGSVQRDDYFPGSSDIDVDIFTDNVDSTITKMQHFLKVNKSDFKKFVWKLNKTNRLANGYKIMYKEPENNFAAEFSIYDEKWRNDILDEHNSKTVLPFYASIILIILKYLFYNLHIIPKETYRYLKKKTLGLMIGLPDDEFIVLDSKPVKRIENI